jgi:hypothetical protein
MNPLFVSYGGGINSTAMLVGFHERNIPVDAIVFADTGAEHPRTYEFIEQVSRWCVRNGLPEVTICKKQCSPELGYTTLEQECLTRGQLPSLAYGFHKCADKWKVQAQLGWGRKWPLAVDTWNRGELVMKAIGFHYDEQRRIKPHIVDKGYQNFYPLVEWKWRQQDCLAAIQRAGLPKPSKSSCFFCPANTKEQVRSLARSEPDLFRRALAIEDAAQQAGNLKVVKGLGRHWTWREIAEADAAQCRLFPESSDTPCGCWDGSEDEYDD